MAGGTWNPGVDQIRPGLYVRFTEAAAVAIQGGETGIVAIPLKKHSGTAETGKFYTVDSESKANELFGVDNAFSVQLALQGGAKEVLVYTLPDVTGDVVEGEVYADAFLAFDTRPFNVFSFDGEVSTAVQTAALGWTTRNRDEGKHFMTVMGGTDASDNDGDTSNARSGTFKDDYVVNVIKGGYIGDIAYNSSQIAPHVAGLIASTAISDSITYSVLPFDDVNFRSTNSEIRQALQAGSLIIVHDGEKVKVESGLTTSGKKIRAIRARQTIQTDITKTASDSYIGKIDNNEDGQTALITAIKAYLEGLAAANVLEEPVVALDPNFQSIGDKVYLTVSFKEVDSMERIFISMNV